tara:strand:- start:207 stop:734 length:528 start_codon:yes stop_codon:yes gene_type:complete
MNNDFLKNTRPLPPLMLSNEYKINAFHKINNNVTTQIHLCECLISDNSNTINEQHNKQLKIIVEMKEKLDSLKEEQSVDNIQNIQNIPNIQNIQKYHVFEKNKLTKIKINNSEVTTISEKTKRILNEIKMCNEIAMGEINKFEFLFANDSNTTNEQYNEQFKIIKEMEEKLKSLL